MRNSVKMNWHYEEQFLFLGFFVLLCHVGCSGLYFNPVRGVNTAFLVRLQVSVFCVHYAFLREFGAYCEI